MTGGVITAERIALLIKDAPAWALADLAAPREGLRVAAQLEVARHVYHGFFQPPTAEATQMPLPW
ncbi:hypothetical protein C8J26_1535 [Sphingomonas aurantiaca]|uniref:Uncharacterized protein n=1 Tax=Sphingomonas aurantiaca TaxID=185949 RepID=A0A2T5GPF4_9SPHN|nr:hypothetical protein C8J26_1535 [Sphingomonas aurantiaca]